MNINLKESVKRKKQRNCSKKPKIQFGLNSRKDESSVIQEGYLSSDNEKSHNNVPSPRTASSSRSAVNRELAAEQAALRLRAEKAMKDISTKSDICDYDADYESFSSGHQRKIEASTQQDNEPEGIKESKYIANLLKKAKERQQEKEIIMERKIAREQEAEGNKDEYLGKDKFVTRGYKRILEEREAWIQKDRKQAEIEEEEDVTKRKGTGLMGFYGNFSQNVALSGRGYEKSSTKRSDSDHGFDSNNSENGAKLIDSETPKTNTSSHVASKHQTEEDIETQSLDGVDNELKEQALKAKRMQKIFEARDRYLTRRRQ